MKFPGNFRMNRLPRKQVRRQDLKPGESLCEYCTAKCCRYFTVSLETPMTAEDMDYYRWYLLHEFATIFTEDGNWFLLVHTECKHLREDNRCGIYDDRPRICREYSTEACEYDDDYTYDQYFETAEQLAEYSEACFEGPSSPRFRSPRPRLPVLS